MSHFTHLDKDGNPSMVDVGTKKRTKRTATARSIVVLDEKILQYFQGTELQTKKGPSSSSSQLAV